MNGSNYCRFVALIIVQVVSKVVMIIQQLATNLKLT